MSKVRFIKYSIIIALFGATSVFNIRSKSNGLSASYTGAPSESTCVSCHSTYSLQTSGTNHGKIKLNGNFTGGGYIPDSTYKITVTYKETGKSVFGFQVTALQDKNVSYPTPAGTFISKDSRTATFSQVAGSTTRYYIEHTSTGTSSVATDSVSYVFEWKAPSSNLGNIKFHLILNVANNNGNTSGDYIYSKSFVVSPSTLLPVAKAKITDTLYCSNTSINFNGSSTNNASSYSWKFPGGSITTSTAQNPIVTYSSTGNKMAILETKNAKGSSKPDTLLFTVIQGATNPVLTPSPVNGPVKICSGDSAQFKVNSIANHSFIWSPNGQKSLAIFAKNSNYYVVTATNSNGCKKTSVPLQLIVNPRPEFEIFTTPNSDSICYKQSVKFELKDKYLSDSFRIANTQNSFLKDSIFNYNLNKGNNLIQFYSKSKNGCVSLLKSKMILGFDSFEGPKISIKSKTTNSIHFQWSNVPFATAYFISLDTGKTWKYPDSGKLTQEQLVTVDSAGRFTMIMVKASTSRFCGTSKVSTLVSQPLGCENIDYSIVPQKNKPCYGDTINVVISRLNELNRYEIFYENQLLSDTIVQYVAQKTNEFYVKVMDTTNRICGYTTQKLVIVCDSGSAVKTDILPKNLVFCGGLNNSKLQFNANFSSGDSLFDGNQYLTSSNPVLINLSKNTHAKLRLKNSNHCFGEIYSIKPDFREKINSYFSVNYLNAYNYQFKAIDTAQPSKWYLKENSTFVDSFEGYLQQNDLSGYSDKTLRIEHFKSDTFDIPCTDSSSKSFVVLNYSGNADIQLSRIVISPNPVKFGHELKIESKDKMIGIKLFNSSGQIIGIHDNIDSKLFNLKISRASSYYLLEIQTINGKISRKIILN